MEKVIRLPDRNIPLTLTRAIVIHANKYSEAGGGMFNFPVTSTLYTDVVFRVNETNEDWRIYVKDINLPLYNGQDVTVMSAANVIVGYVDMQTNYYYYTTGNLAKALGLGIPLLWVWLIGIIGGVIIYLIQYPTPSPWIFAPILAMGLLYAIQRFVTNFHIKKGIKNILSGG